LVARPRPRVLNPPTRACGETAVRWRGRLLNDTSQLLDCDLTNAITAVARAFEDRAGKDNRINQKFARTNFERLTKEFVDQLCQDTGGPCSYTGLSMKTAHTNMGVTSGEFDAFVEDFVATLNDFDVGKAEQDELLSDLAPMRGDIIEVDSPEVATPLPSAFTPAPLT
jgi:hemoglobin